MDDFYHPLIGFQCVVHNGGNIGFFEGCPIFQIHDAGITLPHDGLNVELVDSKLNVV